MDHKPRLLIISHVNPFSRSSGQQQRVYHTLKAAREKFHATLATLAHPQQAKEGANQVSELCDEVILIPARYNRNRIIQSLNKIAAAFYILFTGLKFSNYVLGRLEFSPARVTSLTESRAFDIVLYEYWHAVASVSIFQRQGIPCVLDMHNILWQSYAQQLKSRSGLPRWWRSLALRNYQKREEMAWRGFDALIAINHEELRYVRSRVPSSVNLFYTPMGIDLTQWCYSWEPVKPPRLAYYGGLRSPHNQQNALRCCENIMPHIWHQFPQAELWLVGSNPPDFLWKLTEDPRVKVTGYVEDVQDILRTMSVVLCPWSGKYGFRSRLIEVMALGVPVITSPDAVYGMELKEGKGLFLGKKDKDLVKHALGLLSDQQLIQEQSCLAREQVERGYSFENTYRKFVNELYTWFQQRGEKSQ